MSYEFSLLGVDGLGLSVQRAQGSNAINQLTGSALNDRNEWNISVEYQPGKGFLHGLWLRLRYATVDEKSGSDGNQLRLILNYDIPLS